MKKIKFYYERSTPNIRNRTIKNEGVSMETMSFRFGIDNYIYYNEPIPRNNGKCKEKISTEIRNSKIYNEGGKK